MEKKKFWNYENKLVIIFFFTIGFVFFDRLAINYLFPMISVDLGLNYTQLGLLGAGLALTWSISGPLGGFISDKVKSKKTMLAILVITFSIISLLHGFAQTFRDAVHTSSTNGYRRRSYDSPNTIHFSDGIFGASSRI